VHRRAQTSTRANVHAADWKSRFRHHRPHVRCNDNCDISWCELRPGIANYEIWQNVVGHGARLLGLFTPVITFSLSSYPNWQLIARIHHRSGGGFLWRDNGLFDGVWGASQYFVVGIRHWF
jgi:hypothetical protein